MNSVQQYRNFAVFLLWLFIAIYALWGTFLACIFGLGNAPEFFPALLLVTNISKLKSVLVPHLMWPYFSDNMKELLLWGLLALARSSPILDQNGFKDLIVAIDDTVDMKKGPEIIAAIKVIQYNIYNSVIYALSQELMTQTSSMMFYASNTRFYIKEVTILTPKDWRLPEVSGEARHGEVYQVCKY